MLRRVIRSGAAGQYGGVQLGETLLKPALAEQSFGILRVLRQQLGDGRASMLAERDNDGARVVHALRSALSTSVAVNSSAR